MCDMCVVRLTVTSKEDTSSPFTGGAVFKGGVGIVKSLQVGGNETVRGSLTVLGSVSLGSPLAGTNVAGTLTLASATGGTGAVPIAAILYQPGGNSLSTGVASFTITNAQLSAGGTLTAFSQQILNNAPAGFGYMLDEVFLQYHFVSPAFTGGGTLLVYIGTVAQTFDMSSVILATSSAEIQSPGGVTGAGNLYPPAASLILNVAGMPMTLQSATPFTATGGGSLTVYVKYSIIAMS
jgi:hypothetical protein